MQSLEKELHLVCSRNGKDIRMLEPSDGGVRGEIIKFKGASRSHRALLETPRG